MFDEEHSEPNNELNTGCGDNEPDGCPVGGVSDGDPDEEPGTDLTVTEGWPTDRANADIVKFALTLPGSQFTFDASASPKGVVALASATAVVAAIGGVIGVALFAAGAPAWLAVIALLVPIAVFLMIAVRSRAAADDDGRQTMGRRRGRTGAHDRHGLTPGR